MRHYENVWREALSDLSSSGLSLRKYCRLRHLNYSRAVYWRRRLAAVSEADTTVTFALVQLPGAEQVQDSGVAVECGRHRVRLSTCFDESVMLRVVALLSGQEI